MVGGPPGSPPQNNGGPPATVGMQRWYIMTMQHSSNNDIAQVHLISTLTCLYCQKPARFLNSLVWKRNITCHLKHFENKWGSNIPVWPNDTSVTSHEYCCEKLRTHFITFFSATFDTIHNNYYYRNECCVSLRVYSNNTISTLSWAQQR